MRTVEDAVNDPNSTLGDFVERQNAGSGSAPYDYTYDANGNVEMDLNKGIRTVSQTGMVRGEGSLIQTTIREGTF